MSHFNYWLFDLIVNETQQSRIHTVDYWIKIIEDHRCNVSDLEQKLTNHIMLINKRLYNINESLV